MYSYPKREMGISKRWINLLVKFNNYVKKWLKIAFPRSVLGYGLIGEVKIGSLVHNKEKIYFFEPHYGILSKFVYLPDQQSNKFFSFLQLEDKAGVANTYKLKGLPVDALSRITDIMNMNGKAIEKQNSNMKELEK